MTSKPVSFRVFDLRLFGLLSEFGEDPGITLLRYDRNADGLTSVYVRSQCGRKWPEIPAGPILRGDEWDRRLGGPIHNGDKCCQLGTSNIHLIIFMLSLALHTALSFGFYTLCIVSTRT